MDGNTKKLRALMRLNKINAPKVAELLGRKPNTVRVWRVKNTQRPIPDDTLKLLALLLAQRAAASHRGQV